MTRPSVAAVGAAAFGPLWILTVAQAGEPHMTLWGMADIIHLLLALMMMQRLDSRVGGLVLALAL